MDQIIIIGYGGHAKVIKDCVDAEAVNSVIGYIDIEDRKTDIPYIGSDDNIESIVKTYPNAKYIIGIGDMQLRRKIIQLYESYDVDFAIVIHPTAVVSPSVSVGGGTVVFAKAVINASAVIGRHCILNSGSIVEHDNKLEDNVHMGPGAVNGGQVLIGSDSFVGLGSCVKNNISIGSFSVVGCGSVVVDDVPDYAVVYGVPAKVRRMTK